MSLSSELGYGLKFCKTKHEDYEASDMGASHTTTVTCYYYGCKIDDRNYSLKMFRVRVESLSYLN